jgi:hypothetical protein
MRPGQTGRPLRASRIAVESDCLFFLDGMVAKFDHLKSWRFPAEELQVNHLHALDDVGQAHVVQQNVSNRNGTTRRFQILQSLKAVNPVFLAIEGVEVDIPVRFLAVTECVHINAQDRPGLWIEAGKCVQVAMRQKTLRCCVDSWNPPSPQRDSSLGGANGKSEPSPKTDDRQQPPSRRPELLDVHATELATARLKKT